MLLLTSDDVAQKYHLPHSSRLLRPMALDMTNFEDDITLFLETQTVASPYALRYRGRKKMDGKKRRAYHAGRQNAYPWKAEDIALLENGAVFRDPQRPGS